MSDRVHKGWKVTAIIFICIVWVQIMLLILGFIGAKMIDDEYDLACQDYCSQIPGAERYVVDSEVCFCTDSLDEPVDYVPVAFFDS